MSTKRIDLGDGDWAELTERPTHGQYNAIYKAWIHSQGDRALYMDLVAIAVSTLTMASSIRGDDGQLVDPRRAIDAVPTDKLMPLGAEAIAIWSAVKLPNVSAARSPKSSPADPSTAENSPKP